MRVRNQQGQAFRGAAQRDIEPYPRCLGVVEMPAVARCQNDMRKFQTFSLMNGADRLGRNRSTGVSATAGDLRKSFVGGIEASELDRIVILARMIDLDGSERTILLMRVRSIVRKRPTP